MGFPNRGRPLRECAVKVKKLYKHLLLALTNVALSTRYCKRFEKKQETDIPSSGILYRQTVHRVDSMPKPKPKRNRRMGISIRGHAGSTTRNVSGSSPVVYSDHRNSLFTANSDPPCHRQGNRPFLVGTPSPPQGIHIRAAATQQVPPSPAIHPDRLNLIDAERRSPSLGVNPDRMAMILDYQRENDVWVDMRNNESNEGSEVDLFRFGQGEQSWRTFGEKMPRVNLATSFTRISPPPYHSFSTTSPTPAEMSATPRDRDGRPLHNGVNGTGPHPSFIQVANPYIFEQKIQDCLTALGSSEAKEDNIRLQGVLWIDSVRKALQL